MEVNWAAGLCRSRPPPGSPTGVVAAPWLASLASTLTTTRWRQSVKFRCEGLSFSLCVCVCVSGGREEVLLWSKADEGLLRSSPHRWLESGGAIDSKHLTRADCKQHTRRADSSRERSPMLGRGE